jgi:hypothetical protein
MVDSENCSWQLLLDAARNLTTTTSDDSTVCNVSCQVCLFPGTLGHYLYCGNFSVMLVEDAACEWPLCRRMTGMYSILMLKNMSHPCKLKLE